MAEWSKAVDSKSIVGQPTAGSNPALSAISNRPIFFWRDDRVDEGARLERECRATYRGFESHSLRHVRHCARPKVVVGSSWSGIREPRQDRKVATVSVPPRCGGARPSPGAFFSVTGMP